MAVVVLSTLVFILSTMPELTDDIDMILFTNSTHSEGTVSHRHQTVERWEDVSHRDVGSRKHGGHKHLEIRSLKHLAVGGLKHFAIGSHKHHRS